MKSNAIVMLASSQVLGASGSRSDMDKVKVPS